MTAHTESATSLPDPEQVDRTKRPTDRAICVWITIHVLIVLGWFVYWIDYNHRIRIAEPRGSIWIIDLLVSTAFAFPLMLVFETNFIR